MSRPEHLRCVNTPEGIRRINEMQRFYDQDPERFERRERQREEERQQEQWAEECQRRDFERQCYEQADQEEF